MNQSFQETSFYPADILLPKVRDIRKWAVIACDQFTSQPAYWQKVEQEVGDAPTALRLVLPEVYLNRPDVEQCIQAVNACMETYLAENRFRLVPDSLVYVERTQSDGRIRHGIVGRIDLEQYDFAPGSQALIRATEGTVLERIPPRVRVREHAALELPHVMLLIDDPAHTVIAPLESEKDDMERLYDTDLMLGGGHAAGYRLTEAQTERTAAALRGLITPEAMAKKYGRADAAPLLFAVGDGNHSLATAKTCYENLKKVTPPEQWASLPARYALVEVVNLHDPALQFAPIHRVLFHVDEAALWRAFLEFYPNAQIGGVEGHSIEACSRNRQERWCVPAPKSQLEVGTLQSFLDAYLKVHPETTMDYIHGDDTARELGQKPGNLAFLLPVMGKNQLFSTVMADGVLPRKAFSMGAAEDKRYYLEARKIR